MRNGLVLDIIAYDHYYSTPAPHVVFNVDYNIEMM